MLKLTVEELASYPVARISGEQSNALNVEVGGLYDEKTDILGLIVLDKYDRDYGYIVLKKDANKEEYPGKYAAVDMQASFSTYEIAEEALRNAMERNVTQ